MFQLFWKVANICKPTSHEYVNFVIQSTSDEISLKGIRNKTSLPRTKAGNFYIKCPHVDVSPKEYYNYLIHENELLMSLVANHQLSYFIISLHDSPAWQHANFWMGVTTSKFDGTLKSWLLVGFSKVHPPLLPPPLPWSMTGNTARNAQLLFSFTDWQHLQLST